MSFINFGLVNPRLFVTTDAVAGSTPLGGLLYRPADLFLYVSNNGTIARWLNGLPITADGRVVVSLSNGAVGRYKDGLAFNSLGQLLMTETFPIARFVHGWPVDADGRICVDTGMPATSFNLPLEGSLIPVSGDGSLVPTFVRATTGYETDFENVMRQAAIGEVRFTGYRRVRNLVPYSENFSNAAWVAGGSATTAGDEVTFPAFDGYVYASMPNTDFTVGKQFRASVEVKAGTKAQVCILLQDAFTNLGEKNLVVIPTADWVRYSWIATTDNVPGGPVRIGVDNRLSQGGDDIPGTVFLRNWQLEDVTGQSNQAPSEYVSVGVLSAPYHGAGIDGVKNFLTTNGNSVAANVVTEAVGTPIPAATRKKYLSEGARTNLCLQSQTFDNASWLKLELSVVADQTVAPDGTLTMDSIVENTANAQRAIYQSFASVPTGKVTCSVYAKAFGVGSKRWLVLFPQGAGSGYASFDLSNGTISEAAGGNYDSSSITALPDGKYRCSITVNTVINNLNFVAYLSNAAITGGAPSYTGDGVSGVYIWGAQLEVAPFASSYIPTTTAAVTRNADVLTYPSAGNISGTVGTVYYEHIPPAFVVDPPSGPPGVPVGSNGINRILVYSDGARLRHFDGTSNPQFEISGGFTPSVLNKVAQNWSGAAARGFKDGVSLEFNPVTFDGDYEFADISIGMANNNPATSPYGNIGNVKIWPVALTDAQLQAITTP